MKKLFLAASILCISLSAFASEANRIYLGIEGGTYSYREPHMEYPIGDFGNKIGVSFEWVGRSLLSQTGLRETDDNSIGTFELRYVTGKVDYDGFLMTEPPTPHKNSGEKNWYIEGRFTIGQTYDLGKQFELWPYLGLGYRVLINDGTNVDPSGYKRVSHYWYIPVGLKLNKSLSQKFSLTFNGEFDWLMVGKQQSDILTTGYLDNCQTEGFGLRFGVKAEIEINKKIGFFFEPYYRMWKIQNSVEELVFVPGEGFVYFYEPFNITKEAGVRAGIYF